MEIKNPKVTVSEKELESMTPLELKRRVAKSEGLPEPELTPEEAAITAATERLERLKKRSTTPQYVPFEAAGEQVLIKSLNLTDMGVMSLSLARNATGVLQQGGSGVDVSYIAIYMACVYDEPGKPSFTSVDDFIGTEENPGYLYSHEAMEFLSPIMDKIIEVNPNILATLKKT